MIIGLCGQIGSGKGTIADYLIEYHDFEKISFADKLKDTVAILFDWPRHLLEGDTIESREWREQPDPYWSKALGKDITPRYVLQIFGTECMRRGFHEDVWVHIVAKKILGNPDKNYVIADCRFRNEQDIIQMAGGQLWAVFRQDIAWYDIAVDVNSGKLPDSTLAHVHESEWRWIRDIGEFDKVFYNHGTLQDLHHNVSRALHEEENDSEDDDELIRRYKAAYAAWVSEESRDRGYDPAKVAAYRDDYRSLAEDLMDRGYTTMGLNVTRTLT
jgi:hypothetical protein